MGFLWPKEEEGAEQGIEGALELKEEEGAEQGIEGALELGKFEMVSSAAREKVWDVLMKQQVVLAQSKL